MAAAPEVSPQETQHAIMPEQQDEDSNSPTASEPTAAIEFDAQASSTNNGIALEGQYWAVRLIRTGDSSR